MRQHDLSSPRRTRRRLGAGALIGALSVAALSGCASGQTCAATRPPAGCPRPSPRVARRVTSLWIGAWIAALAVGALVWGLIGWCVVAYRRKKDDNELPVQLRYNIPIEILYTVVPIFMVVVLFYYTARDESDAARHLEAGRRHGQRRRQAVELGLQLRRGRRPRGRRRRRS